MSFLFNPGGRLVFTRTFTAVGGTPIAVVMSLTLQDPAAAEHTVTLGSVSIVGNDATATGSYTLPSTNSGAAGTWLWRWVCTGDIVAAEEGTFIVNRSRVLDT